MVFFSCDRCNEALKKSQVVKHGFKCRNATYSCLDCGQSFSLEAHKNHVKCITEQKKYGGKQYVEKENKGEVKQNRWVEQVQRAIENVSDQSLKYLLEQIRGFDNIPRKEGKFINFLQNSKKISDKDLCIKAWKCISAETKKMEQEETRKAQAVQSEIARNNEGVLNCNEGTSEDVDGEQKAKSLDQANSVEQVISSTNSVKKFKWKRAIKRTLKAAENGEMKLKRLRNIVIESYLASDRSGEFNNSEDLKTIFDYKLNSLNLHINGKIVQLK